MLIVKFVNLKITLIFTVYLRIHTKYSIVQYSIRLTVFYASVFAVFGLNVLLFRGCAHRIYQVHLRSTAFAFKSTLCRQLVLLQFASFVSRSSQTVLSYQKVKFWRVAVLSCIVVHHGDTYGSLIDAVKSLNSTFKKKQAPSTLDQVNATTTRQANDWTISD